MKIVSKIFWVLAALMADIMCAVVAYNYCNLYWSGNIWEEAHLPMRRFS